ncbi:MAG: hypothetical protein GXP35_03440 [Actinobacteria bacterium]|nr:hypothetical protein [Actinomycetota bacterium]
MADETLDDLANAALDGDKRALEAARSNPDLQTLIDEHRRVRNVMRVTPPAAAHEYRQNHLEAALAVFDEMQLTAKPATPSASGSRTPEAVAPESSASGVVLLASKRRQKQRWLNVAAAAAVVGVGAIAAVSLTSIGFEGGTDDAAESSTDLTATTAQASLDSADAPAVASGAAPLDEVLEESAVFDADSERQIEVDDQGADGTSLESDSAPSSTTSSATADTTEAPADAAEVRVVFPEGPLDPRFVDCLPDFDVPDRPWVVSATVSDTLGALELLVGDDLNTLYHFVFDPASCVLLAPAEPVPDG